MYPDRERSEHRHHGCPAEAEISACEMEHERAHFTIVAMCLLPRDSERYVGARHREESITSTHRSVPVLLAGQGAWDGKKSKQVSALSLFVPLSPEAARSEREDDGRQDTS